MIRRICRHIILTAGLAIALICSAGTATLAQGQLIPPVFDTLGLGPVRIFPRIELGYQNLGINFSMPANLAPGSLLVGFPLAGTSHIDLSLKNAGVWVGSVNFDVATAFPFGIFVGAGGSVQKNVRALTSEFPGFENIGLSVPVEWTARRLQYWEVEAGISLAMTERCSLIAGLRREKVTFDLSDPLPPTFTLSTPSSSTATDTLSSIDSFGNFEQNSWIPYVGLKLTGPNYRWSIIGTPFAATEIKVPVSAIAHFTSGGFFPLFNGYVQDRDVTWKYKFSDITQFLEFAFEYDITPFGITALRATPWLKGTWFHYSGGGALEASTAFTDYFVRLGVIVPPILNHAGAVSENSTATFARYFVSYGITMQLFF